MLSRNFLAAGLAAVAAFFAARIAPAAETVSSLEDRLEAAVRPALAAAGRLTADDRAPEATRQIGEHALAVMRADGWQEAQCICKVEDHDDGREVHLVCFATTRVGRVSVHIAKRIAVPA